MENGVKGKCRGEREREERASHKGEGGQVEDATKGRKNRGVRSVQEMNTVDMV